MCPYANTIYMEFDLDIALEFVEKISPEPAPIGGGGSAATGDLMLPIILATLMVLLFSACAFAFFKKRKTFAKHSTKSSLIAKSIPRIASNKIAIAIIAVAVAFLAIFGIATVQAKAAGNESIETPSNVKAYIDKEAGTVEFDSSYLKNICDRELVVE